MTRRKQSLFSIFRVATLCLIILLLWSGNCWAQIISDAKIEPLIEKLATKNTPITDAADALVNIGSPAVSALIEALHNKDAWVPLNAVYALGSIGTEASSAIPDLIKLLDDEQYYVPLAAVKGLGAIAVGFEDKAGSLPSSQLAKLNLGFDKSWEWVLKHKLFLGIAAYVTLLPLLWLILLGVKPLWLLQINNALKPYTDFSLPLISINAPLRYVLFVGWFHYHPIVLDAWVGKYIESAREQFPKKDTVSSHATYIPIPVILEGNTITELTPENLRPTFNEQRTCLLINGEGGVGKTSLACQIACWAMAFENDKRLSEHLMLPVLLEKEFREIEDKSTLLEAIRGQLQALIDEPNPICEKLLIRLLRKKRILVIVHRFSELNHTTKNAIVPDSLDFSVNALVITSRLEEKLGRVNKTTIKPLRIEANKLSSFMEAYLIERGKRDKFTDQEFFDACNRFSQMVSQRNITVLLAKLYAEQLIANLETQQGNSLPENLPNLMLGYLNEVNRDITGDTIDDRTVHQNMKAIAWECLQQSFQPGNAKLADVIDALEALGIDEPETHLEYLENRLHLIKTIGYAQDEIRFCLDPLAEYLAALYAVEIYGNNGGKWRSLFFKKADELVKNGEIDNIQGFILAMRDCYLSQINDAKKSDFVVQKLSKLADVNNSDNTENKPVKSETA